MALAVRENLGTSTNSFEQRRFRLTATTFTKHYFDNSVCESRNRRFSMENKILGIFGQHGSL